MATTRSATTSTASCSIEDFKADAQAAYDRREEELGAEVMRELERRVLLTVLDRKWREHLYEMDYLREGIGLRAMAQRDPLVEYQREGGDMFNAMMEAFMEEVVGFVFHLEVEVDQTSAGRGGHRRGRRARSRSPPAATADQDDDPLVESGPDPDGPGVAVHVLDDDIDEDELEEIVAELPGAGPAEVRAKGLRHAAQPGSGYSAPAEDGSVKTAGQPSTQGRRPVRGRRPQRPLSVRVG